MRPPAGPIPWVTETLTDCPPIFDEPAWDDRRSGWELEADEKNTSCFLSFVHGNPPPADIAAKCPAAAESEEPKP